MKRPWSLKNRITLWVAALTLTLVSLLGVTTTWFVLGATTREFDALAREETDELLAIFRGRELSKDAMQREWLEIREAHPDVGIAWRLWNPSTQLVWSEFGDANLLPPIGAEPKDRWVRWRVIQFSGHKGADQESPLYLGLLLDGRSRLMPLKRSGAIAGSILAITALVAMLGGRIFAARTARQLAQIADGIHQDSDASTADLLSGENPPIEIQRVAEAISEALTKARWEQERNSLLIAGIAHELRSPIQNLLGETEVLLMRARTPEEYRAVLESHTDEIQDLAREVDNLVTLCAHSSNQESSAWETFDLGHEIALRLPRELERAKRREVDIQLDLDGDLNMVGDREALLLMVRNLVGNAVSYSGPKTTVRVSAKSQDGQVLLGVADQGPGVPAQHRARIFEPFQRGADRPGVRSGFGLGLALSREAVLAQGGTLTVCDSETGGALFEARMPMVAPARPGPAASKG